MSDQDDLRLAELLCSRICHDLISPVGALNNGLELLEESGAEYFQESLDLIGQSAALAAARLAFFRAAFGSGGGMGGDFAIDQLRDLVASILDGRKVRLHWREANALQIGSVPKVFGKLLLNLFLVALETIPRGGDVTVEIRTGEKGRGLAVVATGRSARVPDRLGEILSGSPSFDELSVGNVLTYLSKRLADSLDLSLEINEVGEERVEISAL